MLRQGTKENFIRILQDVRVLCEKAIKEDANTLITVLQESQDAVISVGTGLEQTVENPMEIISKMESLCEAFYQLSLNMDNRTEYGNEIIQVLTEIIERVSALPVSYRIVFFPYKVEMWDSLESIWLACKDAPACDCRVVPIPYYHFDAEQNKWEYCYEIDRFPAHVPVVHYAEYDLSEQADAAFVHNPYDEYNHVTHIHSDYYSYNLKKKVKNLFYVPYYVTSGFVADNHKNLSVYRNADYLVVQSETFKEGLRENGYAHKALVMGSPKLDRVIQLSKSKELIPEEWKAYLHGKKSLMLNTSLHQFLVDGEMYLQKIARIFEVVRQREDITIVWRPHPLLHSTIESMRPELLAMYEQLQQSFLESGVGILDTTPDIASTVAIVDGYIGETSSSVVNLFEAAGKPLFILDNYITGAFDEEERRDVFLSGCNKVGEDYFVTSAECSDIFVVSNGAWDEMRPKASQCIVPKWKNAGMYGAQSEGKIYLSPVCSEEFRLYDIAQNECKQISSVQKGKMLNYRYAVPYQNKVFYLPSVTKCIAEYDIENDSWIEHYEPIAAMQKDVTERIFEDVIGRYVDGKYIWMSNGYSNRVVRFNMENATFEKYEIGDASARYSAIAVGGSNIYLSEMYTGEIQVWDYRTLTLKKSYSMPEGYRVWTNVLGQRIAYAQMWLVNEQLFAIPYTSNMLVKVALQTDEVSVVAKELWEDVMEPSNFYHPVRNLTANIAVLVDDETLLVQKRKDASLLEINTRTGEYQIHHPRISKEGFEKLMQNQDGFEKLYTNGEFARRESRYFSFEGFLDDLVNDRLDAVVSRQKEAMQTMAVNLDGTCGEKVHEFMMQVLAKKVQE